MPWLVTLEIPLHYFSFFRSTTGNCSDRALKEEHKFGIKLNRIKYKKELYL